MGNTVEVPINLTGNILKNLPKVSREFKKAGASAAKAAAKFKTAGQALVGVGKGLALGVTLPIVGLGLASLKMASDVTESMNAVNVVFGEGAKIVTDFGKTSDKSVGLSTAAFNQLAAETGALLVDVGLPMKEVAKLTTDLATRAADMASIFNTDVTLAMSAIGQAIRGETEAIRKFGGDVTDATLQQFLLAKGLSGTVTKMTQQEKILLRLQVVMAKSDKFAGDFARTSKDFANALRILGAKFTNIAADLGKMFIPMAQKAVNALSKMLSFFKKLSPATKKMIIIFAGVAAALGPIIAALGFVAIGISAIITAVPVIAGMSGAIAAAIPIVIALGASLAVIGVVVARNINRIKEFLGPVWDKLKRVAIPLMELLVLQFEMLKPLLSAIGNLIKFIGKIIVAQMIGGFVILLQQVSNFIALLQVGAAVAISIGKTLGKDTANLEKQLAKMAEVRARLGDVTQEIAVQTNKLFAPTNNVMIENKIEITQDPVTNKITSVKSSGNAAVSTVRAVNTGSMVPVS